MKAIEVPDLVDGNPVVPVEMRPALEHAGTGGVVVGHATGVRGIGSVLEQLVNRGRVES